MNDLKNDNNDSLIEDFNVDSENNNGENKDVNMVNTGFDSHITITRADMEEPKYIQISNPVDEADEIKIKEQ